MKRSRTNLRVSTVSCALASSWRCAEGFCASIPYATSSNDSASVSRRPRSSYLHHVKVHRCLVLREQQVVGRNSTPDRSTEFQKGKNQHLKVRKVEKRRRDKGNDCVRQAREVVLGAAVEDQLEKAPEVDAGGGWQGEEGARKEIASRPHKRNHGGADTGGGRAIAVALCCTGTCLAAKESKNE